MIKKTLALALAFVVPTVLAVAAETPSTGTITIPIKEYEQLNKSIEADKDKQYWNMTFEQILKKENNNYSNAWGMYEFWNLRVVRLNDQVTENSVDVIIRQISTLNEIDATKPITMVIDSPGGAVFAGFNLINAMNSSSAPVNTVCDGWAMSMAAVAFANGANRVANSGCVFMIHEVGSGAPGGQTTDHIKFAETIINVENILAKILSDNSGLSLKDVRTAWEYETFYNAEETVLLGFADEVGSRSKRESVAGSRTIPDFLLPVNKMRESFNERLTK